MTETAGEIAAAIRSGDMSSREAVERSLARIEAVQPTLNAFALVRSDRALAEADLADARRARGEPLGPLHGVPVAFKDFTPTMGDVTTRGSHAYADWVPDADPVIVRRFKAAGAIVVAKTTTPEFAFSSFTRSPLHGVTRNPWDPSRTPGGSSGGSGVAVATGCVPLAEGTDMGGSIRIPAACCGCVGLKPSLGRIPMDILPTVFDDMSHFGPLARTIEDAALFLEVAEGPDEADISSQRVPMPLPDLTGDVAGRRIALSVDLGFYAVDWDVAANLFATADCLRDAGAVVEPVDLTWTEGLAAKWFDWWCVYQASAFGHLLSDWREKLDPDVVEILDAGFAMPAVDFDRIEQVRTAMWRDLARLFEVYDALLCPTNAIPAPDAEAPEEIFGHHDDDGHLKGFDMTAIFNMVGQCPALSVPSGLSRDGLPTGAQIIGRRFDDGSVLQIGRAVEIGRPFPVWSGLP